MSTATKTHYPLSPSAAHRWLVCPGEPKLRAAVPNLTSEYAEEGTTAHWVGEQALTSEHSPMRYAGMICPETKRHVTMEMVAAVKVYVDECERLRGVWNRIEGKFTLPEISPDLGGTSDFSSVVGTVLNVVDYKHGEGYEVQVEGNPQLLIYALGAYEMLKISRPDLAKQITSVRLTIVQPRIEGDEKIKCDKLLLSELFEWRDKVLKPAIERANEIPAIAPHYVAGDHCRFCPGKATCPAQYQANLAVAQLDFAKPVPQNVSFPVPAALTIDQLARVLEAKDQFESWLGAIEEHAQSVLESGKSVPGFKLVKKRANRAWKDEALAEGFLTRAIGNGAYAPRKLLSPAQAEEALKPFDLKLDEKFVIKPDTGCVIAKASDKRPAVSVLPAAMDFLKDQAFLS